MAGLSENETFRFIELVRSYPCIWDCSNPEYIDRSIARECYISIARAMGNGMSELDARRKMKSLRTQYTMNLKNMAAAQSCGKSKRSTVWKFFRPLDFLRPHVGFREVNTKVHCDLPATEIAPSHAKISSTHNNNNTNTNNSVVNGNIKTEDADDLDNLDAEEMNSDAGTFQGDTDGSVSLSLSVYGDGTDREEDEEEEEEEETEAGVQTTNPGPELRKRHFQARHSVCPQRHTQDLGSNHQRRNCGGPKKKRKVSSVESAAAAADIVIGVAKKLLARDTAVTALSENDHFFRMVALEVSRLPRQAQDRLRYKVHGLLLEEKEKLQE